MADDDEDAMPLCLGVGACHELGSAGRRKGRRRREPIGFIHFGAKSRTRRQPSERPAQQARSGRAKARR